MQAWTVLSCKPILLPIFIQDVNSNKPLDIHALVHAGLLQLQVRQQKVGIPLDTYQDSSQVCKKNNHLLDFPFMLGVSCFRGHLDAYQNFRRT